MSKGGGRSNQRGRTEHGTHRRVDHRPPRLLSPHRSGFGCSWGNQRQQHRHAHHRAQVRPVDADGLATRVGRQRGHPRGVEPAKRGRTADETRQEEEDLGHRHEAQRLPRDRVQGPAEMADCQVQQAQPAERVHEWPAAPPQIGAFHTDQQRRRRRRLPRWRHAHQLAHTTGVPIGFFGPWWLQGVDSITRSGFAFMANPCHTTALISSAPIPERLQLSAGRPSSPGPTAYD